MLRYVHPVAAAAVTLLLLYVGWLGMQARTHPRRARVLLASHARLAPIAYALILVMWVGGLVTTWLLRPELELAASTHFRLGCLLVVVLTASWVTSLQMHRRSAREVHPWLGVAALLLAVAQVFFGLQITP